MQNAVAPKVLPDANSQMPAIICANPPVAIPIDTISCGCEIPRVPTLNMDKRNVVEPKAMSPKGPGEAKRLFEANTNSRHSMHNARRHILVYITCKTNKNGGCFLPVVCRKGRLGCIEPVATSCGNRKKNGKREIVVVSRPGSWKLSNNCRHAAACAVILSSTQAITVCIVSSRAVRWSVVHQRGRGISHTRYRAEHRGERGFAFPLRRQTGVVSAVLDISLSAG